MADLFTKELLTSWGLDAGWVLPMLANAPCGAVVFDEEFATAAVNNQARLLLGIDEVSTNLLEALAASAVVKPGLLRRYLREALRSEARPSVHVVRTPEDRLLFLEFRVAQLGERARICWIRDITDAQQLQQYRLFTEIGRIRADKTSTEDLAERLVDAILEFLSVDIVVLTLLDRGVFRPVAARGMLLEPSHILDPEIHSYLRKAVATQKPVLADGSEWEPGEPMELTGVHYIVPLVAAGEIVGTLHLGSIDSTQLLHAPDFEGATPRFTFDTLDGAFLETLSGYAGAALANVRLFEANTEERAKLRTLVEAIPEGIIVYNARGEIEIANKAARELSGVEWFNLNTDTRPYRLFTVDRAPLSRSDYPFFRGVRDDGFHDVVIADYGDRELHVEVRVVPVPGPDGSSTSYVGTMRDVTHRYNEQRRREMMLSVASHELRSPLTPLVGFLQIMRKQVEKGEELDPSLLGRAEHQVSRMLRLIETLLDVTRIESGSIELHLQAVDLRDVVTRTVDLWRAHPREIEFRVVLPEHPITVRIDPDRFDQVLGNIVDNAVQHSPRGGHVAVRVAQEGANVEIEVRDFGTGIPAKVLPQVFDRFFTMRERRGGMGLGLYITRQIVEHHGGTITIESVETEWTRVKIALPISPH